VLNDIIRADTAEEINAWENDLVNEATNTNEIISDTNGDWWSLIVDKVIECIA
jgi:hypothetical protein